MKETFLLNIKNKTHPLCCILYTHLVILQGGEEEGMGKENNNKKAVPS